jgi:hypothetical protein
MRVIGVAGLSAAALTKADAQHAHHQAEENKKKNDGEYQPQFFNAHEYATVKRLAELIIPADERGPSAADVGAQDFIDQMCHRSVEVGRFYTGGLGWLDGQMKLRYGKRFVEASDEQQTTMLDAIAYEPSNKNSPLMAGVEFFSGLRNMVVDGYFTTREGFKDLQFPGGKGAREYTVPVESLNYAIEKSKLK